MQDLPHHAAEPMGDGPDGGLIAQARQQAPEHHLKVTAFPLDRSVRRLVQHPPQIFIAFGGATAVVLFGTFVLDEYIDQQSGRDDERAQFRQMFQDASRRKLDILLFWSLDRLSREGVLETLQHLQRLTGYGVAWRSSLSSTSIRLASLERLSLASWQL